MSGPRNSNDAAGSTSRPVVARPAQVDVRMLQNAERFQKMNPGDEYVGEYAFYDEEQGLKEVEELHRLRDESWEEQRAYEEEMETHMDRAKVERKKVEEARELMHQAEVRVQEFGAAIVQANKALEVVRTEFQRRKHNKRRAPLGVSSGSMSVTGSLGQMGGSSSGGAHSINADMLQRAMSNVSMVMDIRETGAGHMPTWAARE